jgi:hypothetical protein
MRPRLIILLLAVAIALLTLAPYIAAYGAAGADRFMGFLFNPLDGASYLAKMRQGYEGNWLYSLAFTDNPGPAALLFPWYLALGHLARLAGLPLIAVWQLARLAGCVVFLLVAWDFFGRLDFSPRARALAWGMTAFGSGFGWLALPAGVLTSDLWVSEFIPLAGMLTSAHFPLAMAVILLLAMRIALPGSRPTLVALTTILALGFLLGALQPFAVLPIGTALAVWIILRRWATGSFPEGALAGLCAAGLGILPWAGYDLWAVVSSPQLASWFAQNQTPAAPVWDIALSLGLPGVVCLIALARWLPAPGRFADKIRSAAPATLLLGIWLVVNLGLLFAPFSLQRRLMLGMWIPAAALAAPRIAGWMLRPALARIRALAAALLLLPSSAFFLLALASGVSAHHPLLYLSHDEAAAVDWLAANAGSGDVVLASPETSLWLPGAAGVRVVYGHPMETPDAERAKSDVESFFASTADNTRVVILTSHPIDYLLCMGNDLSCKPGNIPTASLCLSSGVLRVYSFPTAGPSK